MENQYLKIFGSSAAPLVSTTAASSPMTQIRCTHDIPPLPTENLILGMGCQHIPSPLSATEIGAARRISYRVKRRGHATGTNGQLPVRSGNIELALGGPFPGRLCAVGTELPSSFPSPNEPSRPASFKAYPRVFRRWLRMLVLDALGCGAVGNHECHWGASQV